MSHVSGFQPMIVAFHLGCFSSLDSLVDSRAIFKGNGDIRNCICYGAVKLLEDSMKMVDCVRKAW